MIEINLLPDELKENRQVGGDKLNADVISIISIALIGLAIINLCVISLAVIRGIELKVLSKKWQVLEPQRKKVQELRGDSESLSAEALAIRQLSQHRVLLAPKLNKLSQLLPKGVWFSGFALTNRNLVVKGSAFSMQEEGISLVNRFLTNLKADKFFFADFGTLEVTSVGRRTLGGTEVTDFVLTGSLKSK
jgi:Tfp pilus assembly protein PilN